ncbi:VRR-NUC domain-containing protein [Hymenobacter sp. IS2118]|uniref:VRR-NUC domain-containing protein n=1 Tax=Hymenobacter sp. IS2118 TaxID=1505605 RepID=UPI00054D013A|nr:VRR-NUC domain-containing protein [Hymenobacter sp. IS2118]
MNPEPPTMALAKKHDQLPLDLGQLYAADITGAILAFLTHHGYTAWRQNTTGIYDAAKARWRVNPQGRRGVPDIIGFRNRDGVFIGVEVKTGRDQLRDDQKQFLDELKAANGLAFVAHSFVQFQQSFERRGLHRQAA